MVCEDTEPQCVIYKTFMNSTFYGSKINLITPILKNRFDTICLLHAVTADIKRIALFQIILDLLPHIDGHRPGIGQLILRQFDHQVIDALFPIQKVDDGGHHNGNHNANQVHGISHQHGVVSKKHLGEQDVDGQPGVAAHKWRYQHDLEAVPLTFQRTGSMMAGTVQPNPSSIGRNARPESPTIPIVSFMT